jgi:hypothetical protein
MTTAVSDEAYQGGFLPIEFESSEHRTPAALLFVMNHVSGPVPARGAIRMPAH